MKELLGWGFLIFLAWVFFHVFRGWDRWGHIKAKAREERNREFAAAQAEERARYAARKERP